MARLLTWDEVRELRTGDKVFVEHTRDEHYGRFTDGVHRVERDDDGDDVALVDARREKWHVMPEWRHSYNRVYRAWDAEPTQEERGNAPEWGTEVV